MSEESEDKGRSETTEAENSGREVGMDETESDRGGLGRRDVLKATGTAGAGGVLAELLDAFGEAGGAPLSALQDDEEGFSDDFEYPTEQLSDNGWSTLSGSVRTNNSNLVGDSNGNDNVGHSQPSASGTFVFDGVQNEAQFFGMRIPFISETGQGRGFTGYGVVVRQVRFGEVVLVRSDGSDNSEELLTLTDDHGGQPATIRVERDPETYEFTCYYNGSAVGTVVDDTYTDSSRLGVFFGGGAGSQRIDGVSTTGGQQEAAAMPVKPYDETLIRRVTSDLKFSVDNTTDSPLEDVSATASTDVAGVTVEGVTLASGRIGPDSSNLGEVDVTVDPSVEIGTSVPIELEVSAATANTTVTLEPTVERAVQLDVTVPEDLDAEAGTFTPLELTVTANENRPVTEVEIRPDLTSLPGGWSLAEAEGGDLPYDAALRPGGGQWERDADSPVWSKARMSAGERQRIGLTIDIPRSTPPGEATLETEIAGAVADTEEQTVLGTTESTIPVTKEYIEVSLEPPAPFFPAESNTMMVEVDVLAEVTDPEIQISVDPVEGVDAPLFTYIVKHTEAEPRAEATGPSGARWPGQYEFGDTLTIPVEFFSPKVEDIAANPEVVGRNEEKGSASFTLTDATETERSTQHTFPLTLAEEFNDLVVQKQQVAEDLGELQVGDGLEPIQRVPLQLEDISKAATDGDIERDVAVDAVERLVMAERNGVKTLNLLRKTSESDRQKLANRHARNLLGSTLAVALSAATIIKFAARAGASALRFVGLKHVVKAARKRLQDLKFVRPVIKETANEAADAVWLFLPSTETDGGSSPKDNILDAIDMQLDERTQGLERYFTEYYYLDTPARDEMIGLLNDTRPEDLSDGLQGTQEAARTAKVASDGELDADYRAGTRALADFEEDAVVDVTSGGVSFARGSVRLFEGIYTMATTEDPGIDEFVDAIKSYGDAILQFADAVISFLFDFSDTIAGAFFLDLMGDNSRRGIKGIREGNNPF